MSRLIFLTFVSVFLFIASAHGQSRDVYTVRGIAVDESAATVIEAQQNAFATAKLIGARQMISRITLPEDRAAVPGLLVDRTVADQLAVAVDVEEETRGAGRYRGELAVVFNPSQVRKFLSDNEIPYLDQQAARAVLIPIASPDVESAWNEAWPDRSQGRLAPTITSRSFGFSSDADWSILGPEASRNGAQRAVKARLLGTIGAYQADVTVVTAAGEQALGRTRRVATLEDAVTQIGVLLDQTWKEASIVRDSRRTLVEASVMYTSLAEWNTMRSVLAQSPLVSEFQTKAVARDGAVVAFIFAGDGQRLISDFRDRGVVITAEDIGYVLRSAVTSRPVRAQ